MTYQGKNKKWLAVNLVKINSDYGYNLKVGTSAFADHFTVGLKEKEKIKDS